MQDLYLKEQDFTYLDWSDRKLSPGTPGCFLKAYEENGGRRIYYKLSNYDTYRGVFGHECINELVASRLMDVLELEHLRYRLYSARIMIDGSIHHTWINATDNFRCEDEKKMPLDVYYDMEKQERESPLDFCRRKGWGQYLDELIFVDYLICNRDRHGANIEVLIKPDGTMRLAPIFDNGVSLLFSCYNNIEHIREFDVLKDRAVNNFIGSKSLEYNLMLIDDKSRLLKKKLDSSHRDSVMQGLDQILETELVKKIWEMIWRRWQKFEEICN